MYNSLITNFVTKKNWIMRSTFKVLFYVNGSKEKTVLFPLWDELQSMVRWLNSVANRPLQKQGNRALELHSYRILKHIQFQARPNPPFSLEGSIVLSKVPFSTIKIKSDTLQYLHINNLANRHQECPQDQNTRYIDFSNVHLISLLPNQII